MRIFFLLFTFSCRVATASEGAWQIFADPATQPLSGEEVSALSFSPPSDALKANRALPVASAAHESGKLQANGLALDPYRAADLKQVPGYNENFRSPTNRKAVPKESPFARKWWYRKTISLPPLRPGELQWLDLTHVNDKAELFLNGKKITEAEWLGPYIVHRLNISPYLRPGKNVLALSILPPELDSLGFSWMDWNPNPPDKMAGLSAEPELVRTGSLRIAGIYPKVNVSPDHSFAELALHVEILGTLPAGEKAQIFVRLNGGACEVSVPLAPGGHTEALVSPEACQPLRVRHPRLWWPQGMGKPNLYKLSLKLGAGNSWSHKRSFEIGLREINAYLDGKDVRHFQINHQPLYVRGVGWSSDFMFREGLEKKKSKLFRVRQMGYNTIRMEGTLESEEVYGAADRMGLLLMGGWPCCSFWESDAAPKADSKMFSWVWDEKKYSLAEESLRSQLRLLRAHPAFLAWFNGSDAAPHAELEQKYKSVYLDLLKDEKFQQVIARAGENKGDRASEVFGKSGVKMLGPYEHVVPLYWYEDTQNGGAFGFNAELGPGVSLASLDSLRDMTSKLSWPLFDNCESAQLLDQNLLDHTGKKKFGGLAFFYHALCEKYGEPTSLEDFNRKTQLMNYEDHRAMNEAFGRNKHTLATGHIHWMGMNAWPHVRWSLFDYYLRAGGSYYGAKMGNHPLHAQYSYDDNSLWLVNHQNTLQKNLELDARVYDRESNVLGEFRLPGLAVGADSSVVAASLPLQDYFAKLSPERDTLIVVLVLRNGHTLISQNTYWLSRKRAELDYDKAEWYRTPSKTYESLRDLSGMPPPEPLHLQIVGRNFTKNQLTVRVWNRGNKLAFFRHLSLRSPQGAIPEELWSDNFVTLMPGQVLYLKAQVDLRRFPSVKVVEE